jgi:hypothetical protein
MADESDGFLSRWSRRKVQVRQGVAATEPAPVVRPPVRPPEPAVQARVEPSAPEPAAEPTRAPAPAAPTLADVAELTPASDYTRFVAGDVDPAVKNAALKKLFTDPQFNVMDGLDTYIDDYGKPDPLPEGMLRKMAQAKFLGLFSDESTDEDDDAAKPAPLSAPTESNEDTDLRLQPHDAAGRPGAEPGPEPHGGGEH